MMLTVALRFEIMGHQLCDHCWGLSKVTESKDSMIRLRLSVHVRCTGSPTLISNRCTSWVQTEWTIIYNIAVDVIILSNLDETVHRIES